MNIRLDALHAVTLKHLGSNRSLYVMEALEKNVPSAFKVFNHCGIEGFRNEYFRIVDAQSDGRLLNHPGSAIRKRARAFCVVYHAIFCAIEELNGSHTMNISKKHPRWRSQ